MPIFLSLSTSKLPQYSSPLKLKKRFFKESNQAFFKDQVSNINWDNLNSTHCNAISLYETFLNIFSKIYDVNFSLTEIDIKSKKFKTPWFSKGLKESSNIKQRFYIKFLKNKNAEPEEKHKNYKNLFEKLKIKSKNNYYASLLNKHKYDTKLTCQVMKEITGKQKEKSSSLHKLSRSTSMEYNSTQSKYWLRTIHITKIF